ncbi:6-phosphogluconate dehydrogenase C-terminal domain-like protein [Hypoxylon fuscum]|nr:6-phosphogluconate dehydrogenase C-terminal domain-like protein [Hypoxylon fuscum]
MNPTRWIRIRPGTMSNSPRCFSRSASSHPSSRPEWLRRVLDDHAEPPRLYAWTPANLDDAAHPNGQSRPRKPDDERRRIYVLGVGNIGRLYASFLAKPATRPPITLVVHRRERLQHWAAHPGIELVRADGTPERNADFDIEWWTRDKPTHGPVAEPGGIRHLLVATKAADALPQVDRLRRYLRPGAAVAFTQNGMCKLWPPAGDAYVAARWPAGGGAPAWLACVTTHGVTARGAFRSVHAAPADVLVGAVMRAPASAPASTSTHGGDSAADFLAAQIVGAPGLAARRVGSRELWAAQLRKLVVNSVVNPLTAVLRCRNGELFARRGDGLPAVMDVLLQEASRTLRALVAHPSSDGILLAKGGGDGDGRESVAEEAKEESLRAVREDLLEQFSFARLRAMLYDVGAKVAENTSSMLQDVRAGKTTEVQDFNGWLVETARYVDASGDCRLPAHEKLISLVVDGAALTRGELSELFLGGK